MKNINFKKMTVAFMVLLFILYVIPSSNGFKQNVKPLFLNDGNILYVGGSGPNNYTKIQDAINDARDGDTVFVYNGIYYENVNINKSIHLIGENRNTSIIDGRGYNTVLVTASNVIVESFTIFNASIWNNDGILLQYCSGNMILDCDIYNNGGNGIRLYYCNYTMISNCIIHNNQYYVGVFLIYSSWNTIQGCNLSWNVGGACLWCYSNNNTITKNLITNNLNGIRITIYKWDTSNDNHIYHNNFINNRDYNAFDICDNHWDNGYPSGGNYWDNYYCIDADGDGIGDTPYNISGGNNQDNYPLMYPFYPTHPDIVYIDDDFNKNTSGWGYDKFNRIQYGINEVPENSTIYVYNGTYYENIVVDKSINLIGEDRNTTVIDGCGSDSIVNIKTDLVNISRFTIQNGGSPNLGAVNIEDFDFNTIYENVIINNRDSVGVRIYRSDGNIISRNNFEYYYGGVSIAFSDNNVVYRNIFTGNCSAIEIFESSYNNVIENQVIKSVISLYGWCDHNRILRNNIYYHPGGGGGGAFFDLEIPIFSKFNTWLNNFWNRPRYFPKPIFGRINYEKELYLPWITFDWHPAKKPYDIGV